MGYRPGQRLTVDGFDCWQLATGLQVFFALFAMTERFVPL
jgi:hypothetical protein